MEWNFADLFEGVADVVPGTPRSSAVIAGDDLRRARRAIDAAREPPHRPRRRRRATTSASTRTTAPSGSRRCSASGRPVRFRSTSTTATSRPSSRTSSTTPISSALVHGREFIPRIAAVTADCPEAGDLRRRSRTARTRTSTPIGAVEYEAALAAASREALRPAAQPGRSLHALHGWHHRHAQGRDVAPGGLLPLHHRRARWRGGTTFESTDAGDRAGEERRQARRLPVAPLMHGAAQWVALDVVAPGQPAGAQRTEEDGPARGLVDGRARERADDQPRRRCHGAAADRGARRRRGVLRPLQAVRDRLRRRDPLAGRQAEDRGDAPARRRRRLAGRVGDGLPGLGRGRRLRGQAPLHDGRPHDGPRRRRRPAGARLRGDRPPRPQGLHAARLLQGRGEDGVARS